MAEDEVDDGLWIDEAVRMVAGAGLVDDLDVAAKVAVAALDDGGVLIRRHDLVGVAADEEQGDARVGERLEVVDGIAFEGQRLRLGEAPGGQAAMPGRGVAGASFTEIGVELRQTRRARVLCRRRSTNPRSPSR